LARKLGVDELICPEHATSLAIARSIRNPGLIALEEFGQGQLLMQRVPVSKGASAIGKQLSDLAMPASARLVTVERGDLVSLANANTIILNDDVVTLIGEQKTYDSARRLFNKDSKHKRQTVAILGETSTAVWLCRALKARDFSVRLFTQDHERAVELSNKLSHVTVVEGDPTDLALFVEERMETLDAFVAVTDDDEQNILACAQSKALGVKSVIAVVQRSKYLHLLEHVRIDHAFSPRQVAVSAILHLIEDHRVRSIATFAAGVAEVYEVRSVRRSNIVGANLRDLKLPASSMIAALRRGEQVFVPGAQHQIEERDTVLVIGPHGITDELRILFGPS
jgi:trk system potassium uptake protein TrkA